MVWQLLNVLTACATLGLTLYVVRSIRDPRTLFVVLAVWARYVLSSFDEYTYPSVVAGFSINSLSSIAVAFAGLALVPPRLYVHLLGRLFPLGLILAVVVLSGLLNSELGGMIKDTVKWLYFVAIALLLYYSFQKYDAGLILRGLFAASLTPLILQLFSVVLGKGSIDYQGTTTYIGGYGGQAGFSLTLFTILCIGALIRWRYTVLGLLIAAICVAGIFLANYRTTILAALPLIGIMVADLVIRWTPRVLRPLSLLYVALGACGAVALFILFMPPRFLDIMVVFQSLSELMKPPETFTPEERDLFSGRIHLWVQYVTTWWEAPTRVHILGFGPEAWDGVQRLYAHNTFVSYLYEFGVVGVAFLLLFFVSQLAIAMRAAPSTLAVRLTAGFCGFIIANLATMPLWLIEGLILLALLCALSWSSVDARRRHEAQSLVRRPIGARWAGTRHGRRQPTGS